MSASRAGVRFLTQSEVDAFRKAVDVARSKSQGQALPQWYVEKIAAERLLNSAPPPKRMRRRVVETFSLLEAVGRAEAMIIMHAMRVYGNKREAAKKLRVKERTLRFKLARLKRMGLMGPGIPFGLKG